jgi:hypothetical protein
MSKLLLVFCCFLSQCLFAQERITALGIQIKPMIPSHFFGTGPLDLEGDSLKVNFTNRVGWSGGMVIRKGLSKMWSIESGISMVQRNYQLNFYSQRYQVTGRTSYQFIGYEIPLQALIYVQLGKKVFMNASAGVSSNFYPSNLLKQGYLVKDTSAVDFSVKTYRARWNQVSIVINYGFEFRSEKKGYYYLGASYNRPLSIIGISDVRVEKNGAGNNLQVPINGSYLTVDLRYFFHEDPARAKKRIKKEGN